MILEWSVSASELDVLRAIRHGAHSPSEIAERTSRPQASISTKISGLIREGYVRRETTQRFVLTGKTPKFVRFYKGNIKPIGDEEFAERKVVPLPLSGTLSGFIAPIPLARLMAGRA